MLKNLLNKIFRKLEKATEVETVKKVVVTPAVVVKPVAVQKRQKEETIETAIANIQAQIYSKGYKAIPEILSEYKGMFLNSERDRENNPAKSVLQSFVLMQKNSLGEYAPEEDFTELESASDDELIKMAQELNQMSFEKRMIESGKAAISIAQQNILTKYGLVATNKFDASRAIDKYFKEHNISTNSTGTEATEAQKKLISSLCTKLHKNANNYVITDKKSASAAINDLQIEMDKAGIVNGITAKQMECVERYMKLLKKRITAKRKEELSKLTVKEASDKIAELRNEYNTQHPEASEGQISYIISLCSILNLPCNPEEVKTINKQQATMQIERLQKQYLFVLTRITSPSMTKADISKMDSKSVKDMIAQIREENKSHDYKNGQDRPEYTQASIVAQPQITTDYSTIPF